MMGFGMRWHQLDHTYANRAVDLALSVISCQVLSAR